VKIRRGAALMLAAFGVLRVSEARADETCSPLVRSNVVPCAISASLPARAEREQALALEGRWAATSPWFPSNPVVSVWGSRRFPMPGTDLVTYNWYGALSQEFEIAGQRGARRRVVGGQHDAQREVITATDREVAAGAWNAYFEVLAAQEDLRLVQRVESLFRRVSGATTAAADKGLVAGLDADVADAALVRISQARIGAEQQAKRVMVALATRLAFAPTASLSVQGDLEPLAVGGVTPTNIDRIADQRPEVRALDAERGSLEAKGDYYRRLRWPNPTVSVFVQNDELNQPVVGLGLSFPLVLPQPLGRTYAGEIDESEALARKTRLQAEQLRREARKELSVALQAYEAARQGRDLYTDQRIGRADTSLQSIVKEIENGRLAVRDAVVAQQTLMDLLRGNIESKLTLCLASVALAKAAGIPLERGGTL